MSMEKEYNHADESVGVAIGLSASESLEVYMVYDQILGRLSESECKKPSNMVEILEKIQCSVSHPRVFLLAIVKLMSGLATV